jgi:hypothetical protein
VNQNLSAGTRYAIIRYGAGQSAQHLAQAASSRRSFIGIVSFSDGLCLEFDRKLSRSEPDQAQIRTALASQIRTALSRFQTVAIRRPAFSIQLLTEVRDAKWQFPQEIATLHDAGDVKQ